MRGGECRLSRYHCPGISLFRVPLQRHQLERFLHLNKLFLQDLMPETPLQGSRDEEISLTDGPCHSDAAALVMRQEAGHWWWPNPQGSWGHSQHPMGTARAVPCRGGQDASSCLLTSPAHHSGTLREGWHLTASWSALSFPSRDKYPAWIPSQTRRELAGSCAQPQALGAPHPLILECSALWAGPCRSSWHHD